MSSTHKAAAARAARGQDAVAQDAIELLTIDHREVRQMFRKYEALVDDEAAGEDRRELAELICTMVTVHAFAEEEIFYPAARGAIDAQDLLDEASVEHQSAKELVASIEAMTPEDPLYDATVKVLGEYIDHHVQEEESRLFPKVKNSGLDLDELGAQMAARKEQLLEA